MTSAAPPPSEQTGGRWEPTRRPSRGRRGLLALAAVVLIAGTALTVSDGGPSADLPVADHTPPPSPPPATEPPEAAAVAAGRWTALGAPPLERRRRPAVAWTGDELVVVGGWVPREVRAEDPGAHRHGAALDPRSGTWRQLPPAPVGDLRIRSAAWAWADGKLVVLADDGGRRAAAAALNPDTDRWESLPSPPGGRWQALGWTGREVLALGATPGGARGEVRAWHDGAERWERVEDPPITLLGQPATLATDAGLAVLGWVGGDPPAPPRLAVALWDAQERRWRHDPDRDVADVTSGRAVNPASDPDGQALWLLGDLGDGIAPGGEATAAARWHPDAGWELRSMPAPPRGRLESSMPALTTVADGLVVAPEGRLSDAAMLDLGTGLWTPLADPPDDVADRGARLVAVDDAGVLAYGGYAHGETTLAAALWRPDDVTAQPASRPGPELGWERLPDPPVAPTRPRLLAAGDEVVFVGGYHVVPEGEDPLVAATLTPDGAWTRLPPPPLSHFRSAAWAGDTLLVLGRDDDGRHAMVGLGRDDDGWAPAWTVRAQPPADRWTVAASGTGGGHLLALDQTRRVSGDPLAAAGRAWRYQVAADRWDSVELPFRVQWPTAVKAIDGGVVMIARLPRDHEAGPLPAIAAYDADADAWTEPEPLPYSTWKPGLAADPTGDGVLAHGPNPGSGPNPATGRWHPESGWERLAWPEPAGEPGYQRSRLHRDNAGERLLLRRSGDLTRLFVLDLTDAAAGWRPVPPPPLDVAAPDEEVVWTGTSLVVMRTHPEPTATRLVVDPSGP